MHWGEYQENEAHMYTNLPSPTIFKPPSPHPPHSTPTKDSRPKVIRPIFTVFNFPYNSHVGTEFIHQLIAMVKGYWKCPWSMSINPGYCSIRSAKSS